MKNHYNNHTLCGFSVFICSLMFLFSPHETNANSSLVGTTKGSLTIDQGIANYSIPIVVPPGVGGMQPELSLNYSSQGGNGALGLGWSIGGLSAIHRCPSNLSQDGEIRGVKFDAQDKLCLDGQRLVAVKGGYGKHGTEYRTEVDGFSRIISYGTSGSGPVRFVVWTKSGQVMSYGGTENSRIEAQGKDATNLWALSEIKDSLGNAITFEYDKNESIGEYNISLIAYEGGEVRFEYMDRPDKSFGYQAGSRVSITRRLAKVVVYRDSYVFREYIAKYDQDPISDQSLLVSITECVGELGCLPPSEFEWSVTGLEFGSRRSLRTYIGDSIERARVDLSRLMLGDFNGDGVTDIYRINGWNSQGTDDIYFFDVNGNANLDRGISTWVGGDRGRASVDISRLKFGDFNGDGRTDIYHIRGWKSLEVDKIYLSKGNGVFHVIEGIETYVGGDGGKANVDISRIKLGDFNGDGLTDIYQINGWNGWGRDYIYFSDGSGGFLKKDALTTWVGGSDGAEIDISRLRFIDLNGDGRTDIYQINGWNSSAIDKIYLSNGDGSFEEKEGLRTYVGGSAGAAIDISRLLFGDFNGDGITDIYYINGWGNSGQDYIYYSRGDGGFEKRRGLKTWVSNDAKRAKVDISRIKIVDFNGDGKSDIYQVNGWGSSGQDYIYISIGADRFGRYKGPVSTWIGRDSDYALFDISRIMFSDFDGDGHIDLYQVRGWGSSDEDMLWVNNMQGRRITKITNGFGAFVELQYEAITNGQIYQKGNQSKYPFIDYQGPQYVVVAKEEDDGVGGSVRVTYRYGESRVHVRGRGPLGFRWVEAINESTGRISYVEHRQDVNHPDFPFNDSTIYTEERIKNPDGSETVLSTSESGSVPIVL